MGNSLQDAFLEKILDQFKRRSEAVATLGDLLGLGKDAVYRRLRGDTDLTPEELKHLARHFRLSIDELIFEEPDRVNFRYQPFSQPVQSFQDYLSGVRYTVKEAYEKTGARFFYSTAEIPIFHYSHFPELMAFKMYVWGRTIWNLETLSKQRFTLDLFDEENHQTADDILNLYNSIPSTELWHLHIFDNTLSQIEYHLNIGGFANPEDALVLCDHLLRLVDHLQLMAKEGKKFRMDVKPEHAPPVEFDLYHNEMVFTNNTFLLVTPESRHVYTTFCNPNFLRTADEKLAEYTDQWFQQIISKSVSISCHEEKNRTSFFKRLTKNIERKKEQLTFEMEL